MNGTEKPTMVNDTLPKGVLSGKDVLVHIDNMIERTDDPIMLLELKLEQSQWLYQYARTNRITETEAVIKAIELLQSRELESR